MAFIGGDDIIRYVDEPLRDACDLGLKFAFEACERFAGKPAVGLALL
jgi:hypothetical protein